MFKYNLGDTVYIIRNINEIVPDIIVSRIFYECKDKKEPDIIYFLEDHQGIIIREHKVFSSIEEASKNIK